MEVIILPDPEHGALMAARIVRHVIARKPRAVLGLATGNTPLPVYKELIRMHREEGLDFSQVTCFNLDEYVGLAKDHPCSYHRYMRENLFDHINVPEDQVFIPDGTAQDVVRYCEEYEETIRGAGGIDLQLLGLGQDGHIGFNEPASSLASRTRLKTLTQTTVAANRYGFPEGEPVPRHVITMGVGTILESGRCLILATGKRKADAVAKMIEGPVTAFIPASALQLHPDTVAVLDVEAAVGLVLHEYYRNAYNDKPEWQKY